MNKPLPKILKREGYNLILVEETEHHAIYHQTGDTYEVIRKRWKGANDKFDPLGFRYPYAEEWGILAWTCHGLDRAKERAREADVNRNLRLREREGRLTVS